MHGLQTYQGELSINGSIQQAVCHQVVCHDSALISPQCCHKVVVSRLCTNPGQLMAKIVHLVNSVHQNPQLQTWIMLRRPLKLIVANYLPAEKAAVMSQTRLLRDMQLVHDGQAQKLQDFGQYLQGFRGAGNPTSQPKVAVVKTASYKLLLLPVASSESSVSRKGLSCSVLI